MYIIIYMSITIGSTEYFLLLTRLLLHCICDNIINNNNNNNNGSTLRLKYTYIYMS